MIPPPTVALLATAAGTAALVMPARRRRRFRRRLAWALAALLAGSELVVLFWPAVQGTWSAASDLPLQLSDLATISSIAALLLPDGSAWARLGYLWGLPAGLLSLSFPAIGASAPSPLYYAFWLDHGGLVAAALLLASGGALRLGWMSVVRVWVGTCGVAALAGAANLITGGDYMFLRRPPPGWDPLDAMGPWPWYVLAASAVALLVFALLSLPFRPSPPPATRRRLPPQKGEVGSRVLPRLRDLATGARRSGN